MNLVANPPKRWLNTKECADYIGRSVSTLYHMVEERRIPFNRPAGTQLLRFDVRAIDAWMEKSLVKTAPKIMP